MQTQEIVPDGNMSGVVAGSVAIDLGEAARGVARGLRRPSVSPITIAMLARMMDWGVLALGLWFSAYATAGADFGGGRAALAAGAVALAGIWVVGLARGYRPRALARLGAGWLMLASVGLAGAALGAVIGVWGAGAEFLPIALIVLAAAALLGRGLLSTLASWALDFGLTERRAVVVGGGSNAAELMRGLALQPENDIRICGIFDDRDDARSPPVVMGVPKIGNVRDLLQFARTAEIDMLIVTLPLGAERRIREVLDLVRVLPLDMRLSEYSEGFEFPRRAQPVGAETGLIDVMRRPLAGAGRIRKRAFDVAIATVALVVLTPVLLGVAAAIRFESRGPVIFRQKRHGYNHRSVEVWKFRSMFDESCDATARRVVTREDPRVTRVGRFIRKWSLDELPQLVNVLRGDLSLVGPRPHVLAAVSSRQQAFEEIVEGYAARHKMPPGVTGWAQIHGWRGEIDDPEKLQKRFEHDLYYIENWSIWLDLYVLAMTPLRLTDTRNAY